VLCLDKPAGMTSFAAVTAVRRRLGADKAGHCGTLDPMATGVLPVCVGEATKLVQFLVDHDKTYLATVRLGIATDTQDAEGAVVGNAAFDHVTARDVASAAASFVGRYLQKVPAYSAVRVQGERLYERARRGEEVEAPERQVHVHALRVVSCVLPVLELEVECGRGTYVRAIASDLGERLGTVAHLAALRRTRVGAFRIEDAVALDDLEGDAVLVSARDALRGMPELALDAEESSFLARSGRLNARADHRAIEMAPTPRCAVIDSDGELAAVIQIEDHARTMLRVFRSTGAL
jgi:tRNA pseudouridine55 synthase